MRRRELIRAAGAAALGGIFPAAVAAKAGLAMPSKSCKATPRSARGPFFTTSPLRSDIREGREGVPLKLSVRVLNDWSCEPIAGVPVEIWQCDAAGVYSNVENIDFDYKSLKPGGAGPDTRGQMFLRGHQLTDERGAVEFTTIFPGWYTGRVPHLHLHAVAGGAEWTAHDTQLFFDPAIERAVYATAAYAARGQSPMSVERDLVLHGDRKALKALTLALDRDGDGYRGRFALAMQSL